MKIIVITVAWIFGLMHVKFSPQKENFITHSEKKETKFNIKIKNDTGDDVKVINAGSGGSYSLTKGATTTIKMENGDQLYYYNKGKKGALILTATAEMNDKVQLLSKL